ncbi:MAG: hypothetical protein ACFB0G_03705 [Leptolyngbyaceae cyanobacterium]
MDTLFLESLMDTLADSTANATEGETSEMTEAELPLSLPHQAEIWSGRFAMLGFMTAVMAIALM